jgi:hypothetical protein
MNILVCLAVNIYEAASFIRRFLRHPQFQTQANRKGKIIRASHRGMTLWRLHSHEEESAGWPG